MKFRLEQTSEELLVIMEDGGIACIRDADALEYKSIIDLYQDRFDQEMIDNQTLWEELGEGKMYVEESPYEANDIRNIQFALEWLSVGDTYEYDPEIWEDLH